MKRCCCVFAAVCAASLFAVPAQDSDGFYEIATKDDFLWLNSNLAVNAKLVADITLDGSCVYAIIVGNPAGESTGTLTSARSSNHPLIFHFPNT